MVAQYTPPRAATIQPMPLLGTLGDSRIAQGFTSPGGANTLPHGAASWVEGLTNGRVRLPWANSQAVSGAKFSDILATQLPLLLALNPRPTHCIVLCGTNDIAGSVAQATIKANALAVWNALKAAGIRPVQMADLPRTVASWTATNLLQQQDLNQWFRTYAGVNGAAFVDPSATIADPASANGDPLTAYAQSDGIHPTSLAAYQCGLALQGYFNQVPLPYHLRPVSRGDAYDATNSPRGNQLPNGGLFSGTGGSNTSTAGTASGTVADGWNNRILSGAATTAVASLVARSDAGGVGWWQQVVYTATNAMTTRIEPISNLAAGVAGETYVGEIDVNVTGSSKLLYLNLNCFDVGGASGFVGIAHKNPGIAAMYLPAAYSIRLVTPPFLLTAGTTRQAFRIEAAFDAGGAATVQIGAATLRKVVAQ